MLGCRLSYPGPPVLGEQGVRAQRRAALRQARLEVRVAAVRAVQDQRAVGHGGECAAKGGGRLREVH